MLFVLNRDFQIIGLASNEAEDTLHYYDDTLHTELASGVSTYEFTVPKNHEDSQHIQEGNYITFKNSKGKQLLFTIMEMEENGNEKVVYCEDIGLDLLNETVAPVTSETAQPIAFYLNHAIDDSGWEIGVNELAHLNRTLSFESDTNALERVLSILNAFDDAEVDFTVEFSGNTVAHQYLNIYKRVGRDTGIRLDAGIDLVEARRTVSMEGLVTALQGVGKEIQNDNPDLPSTTTDFSSIVYDDGRYYSELGDTLIRDREANLKWSRFRNGQAQWRGYIIDIYNYDTDSPQELFNRTLRQLQKRNEPAVTYEVDITKIDVDLSIGDTVTIVDSGFKPALYLQARVLSVDESETDDSKNSIKLGNYVLLTSSIEAQLKELQATLREVKVSWFDQNQPVLAVKSSNGEAFFNNNVNTVVSAIITRGGIDTTSAYQETDFVWTKKDRLGNTVGGWSQTGKALPITYADVLDKATFICTVSGLVEQITIFNTLTTIESATEPLEPQQGQQWIDTSLAEPEHKIYLSGAWGPVTPVTETQFNLVQSDLESAKTAIEPSAITNTVMGTTTFTAKLAEYATADSLSGYATTGALDGVNTTAQAAKSAIDALDLTPYVKTTQVEQLEDSINTRISQSGGVNILRNSIGWNGTDFWVPTSGAYTVQTIQNPELESMGFGAGWYSPIGTYTHHRQELTLPALGTYTLNFYMKKSAYNASYAVKHAGIDVVVDGVNLFTGLDGVSQADTLTNGFELFSCTFEAKTSKNIMVRLSITDSSETTVSGLMLNLGDQPLQWSSHSTEVYNTNVRMDINGIQVMGNRDGSKTVITPDEFSGYEDGEKIFTLNGDTTEVKKLKAEQQFEMAPITIVTIDNATYKGWAFI